MIRKVITVENEILTLSLPNDFVGKKVEVLAFVIDDVLEIVKKKIIKKKKFTVIKVSNKDYVFNRDELYDR